MIYFISGRPWIDTLTNSRQPVIDAGRYQYQIIDNELSKLPESAKEDIACNWFTIEGIDYRIINNAESFEYSSATEDNLYLVDKDGDKLEMPLEIVYLLRRAMSHKVSSPYVAGMIRGYQEKRGNYLFIANFETKKVFAAKIECIYLIWSS